MLSSAATSAQIPGHPTNIHWLSAAQYAPDFTSPVSFASNPAAYPSLEGISCSVYSEKKYMIEGLNLLAFSGMFTRTKSAIGLNIRYFGNTDYNEMEAGINYGRSLGKIHIGTGVNYSSLNIAGFAKQSAINICVATIWELSENIYTGLQIINPRISRNKQMQAAPLYKLGFSYRHSAKVYSGFEFFKEEDKPPQVLAALYYRFAETFFARAGFVSGANQLFCGAGWMWKDFRIEVLSSQHAVLGPSPAILFTYQKNNED